MTADLALLRAGGVLSAVDVHAARTWARIGGEDSADVLLAAALASRAVAAGHVCLELDAVPALVASAAMAIGDAGDEVDGGDEGDQAGTGGDARAVGAADVAFEWPAPADWRAALAASPLVHSEADARRAEAAAIRPLVLDAAGRLYLRRYWEHQERLAVALRARLDAAEPVPVDGARLAEGLERLFPAAPAGSGDDGGHGEGGGGGGAGEGVRDLQRAAADGAVRSRFFVVSGGPGTGKTSTVVKILALLVEQADAQGAPPPRIRLLAPTGKAAAHLQLSVARSAAGLDCADAVRAAIPTTATTVHRALGAGGRPTRYRHDAANPIDADVVLVDEASMVDLALMSRLVTALPPDARLILLGDRDQLASVEAGAVLGDIAGDGDASQPAPARPVVHLTRSHRFAAASDLGALVAAVHAGDADAVLALLDDPARGDVRRTDPDAPDALREAVHAGYAPFAEATGAEARLAALDRFRVLCAHRRGPGGVAELNALVEALLARAGVLDPEGEWYPGRPVGITRNDYEAGLYNGDVGIVAEADGRTRVLFRAPDGTDRWLSPLRVGAAETVFAMSVHKAQGSEVDGALIVLPHAPSPVVTRELLYTAVSRARRSVHLHARADVIREALARRVVRASGLRDAIWG